MAYAWSFGLERLNQSVVDPFRRLEATLVFLVCITSTLPKKAALFGVICGLWTIETAAIHRTSHQLTLPHHSRSSGPVPHEQWQHQSAMLM